MLRLALSTLAARKGSAFGAFAAVGLAVLLLVSSGILLESSLRAPIPVERLRGAAVVVQGEPQLRPAEGEAALPALLSERRRLPLRLGDRLRGLPGVAGVVADRSVYAQALDRHGRLLETPGGASVGHGWSSARVTPYALVSGRPPLQRDHVVVDRALAVAGSLDPGDRLAILTARGRRTFVVSGVVAAKDGPSAEPLPAAVLLRDDVAAGLSPDPSRADLLAVLAPPGTDASALAEAVRERLGQPWLRVLTGAKRGEAESPDDLVSRDDTVAGLTVFGVLASFVAVFVVASTFALSVRQRHRELALLRAIGGTPRQVRRMVAAEAFVLALLAVLVASPLAVVLAQAERGLFARAGIVPDGVPLVIGWLPFLAGLVAAVLTTQLAAFASARRAARIRPTDALREAAIEGRPVSWRRGLTGLAALVGGVVVLVALTHGSGSADDRASDAPAATMIFMLAAALLGPLLAVPFVRLLGGPLAAVGGGPGLLADANLRANLRRAASVATPLMLAVSLVATLLFGRAAFREETTRQTGDRLTGSVVLRSHDAEGLPADLVPSVRRVPGVAQAAPSVETSVVVATGRTSVRSLPARGVDPAALRGAIDLGVRDGSLRDLRGRSLAVGADTASSLGWRVGDRVGLWLGDGTAARLKVVATFDRPLGFGEVVVPQALVAAHVTEPLVSDVVVSARPGEEAAVVERLRGLARAHPTATVLTRGEYARELEAAAQEESLGVYVLLAVVGVFCGLALVNALAMATAERAREFALLRLLGASRRQVRTMVRGETTVMVVFGLAIGSIVALPGLAALGYALTGSIVPSISVPAYAGLLVGYAALAFAAIVVPTRLALRLEPVGAMAARE